MANKVFYPPPYLPKIPFLSLPVALGVVRESNVRHLGAIGVGLVWLFGPELHSPQADLENIKFEYNSRVGILILIVEAFWIKDDRHRILYFIFVVYFSKYLDQRIGAQRLQSIRIKVQSIFESLIFLAKIFKYSICNAVLSTKLFCF